MPNITLGPSNGSRMFEECPLPTGLSMIKKMLSEGKVFDEPKATH